MKAFASLIVSILSTAAYAQQYYVPPSSVPLSTRDGWCKDQKTQCPLICLQTPAHSAETEHNSCDPATLTYSCVCSNGQSPNVSEYSQTLPYFICTQWGTNCVNNCGENNNCAAACRQDHPCGALNPAPPNKTVLASQTATKKGGSGSKQTVYHGFAGQGNHGGGGDKNAGVANARLPKIMELGHATGVPIFVGGLFLVFALVL